LILYSLLFYLLSCLACNVFVIYTTFSLYIYIYTYIYIYLIQWIILCISLFNKWFFCLHPNDFLFYFLPWMSWIKTIMYHGQLLLVVWFMFILDVSPFSNNLIFSPIYVFLKVNGSLLQVSVLIFLIHHHNVFNLTNMCHSSFIQSPINLFMY